MFLIPENLLENLVCDGCKKYLSVGPIKVYASRRVLCHRCVKNSYCDATDGAVNSLYNRIADQLIFPCINRYEGCSDLLSYKDMLSHEKKCVSGSYKCPNCKATPPFSAFEFLGHFKSYHRDDILKQPVVKLLSHESVDKDYLFVKGNFLFLIHVSLMKNGKDLNLWLQARQVRNISQNATKRFTVNIVDTCNANLGTFKSALSTCQSLQDNEDNTRVVFSDLSTDYFVFVGFQIVIFETLFRMFSYNTKSVRKNFAYIINTDKC